MNSAGLLRGVSVQLSACTTADLPIIVRWHQDAAFLRLFDALPAMPKNEAALAQWLDEQHKSSNAFLFAVRLITSNALIGYVELNGILWTHQVGWLAIAIGDGSYQGQGYGREALELALRFAFDELNLYRVQLTVFAYNQRAIALYEKLGFRREGTYREFLHRDGARHDMYLYGLLRHEWMDAKSQGD